MSEECLEKPLETAIKKEDDSPGAMETLKSEAVEEKKELLKEELTANESIDELKCLQKEIEEIKNEIKTLGQSDGEYSPRCSSTPTTTTAATSDHGDFEAKELEREDLIAVLTGDENIDSSSKHNSPSEGRPVSVSNNSTTDMNDSEIPEDVTIEGEGSFQIMEVVDDEEINETINLPPSTPSKPVLTIEEERAIAMQQMADITKQKNRAPRNRPESETKISLAQAIGADWSDEEKPSASIDKIAQKSEVNIVVVKTENEAFTGNEKAKGKESPLVTSVVVLPPSKKSKTENSVKSNEGDEPTNPNQTQSAPPSGFRRTRIIKRKIIWDPDAPETAVSYAQFARSKATSPNDAPSIISVKQSIQTAKPATPVTKQTVQVTKQPIQITKQPNQLTKQPAQVTKQSTPIVKQTVATTKPVAQVTKQPIQTVTVKKEPIIKKVQIGPEKLAKTVSPTFNLQVVRPSTPISTSSQPSPTSSSPTTTTGRKRSQTPITNGGSAGKKKKVSEIEKLMGDEGAVNMINDIKRNNENLDTTSRARQNEKTTKQILSSTRKDSPTLQKPKRAPKAKASAQWDYVYNQKAHDDAMIIRRRSNSSYSSSASLHRSSIDSVTPITKTTTKSSTAAAKTAKNEPVKSAKTTGNGTNSTTTPATASNTTTAVKNTNKKTFEFIKPQTKANKQQQQPQPTIRRGKAANNKSAKDFTKAIENVFKQDAVESDGDNVGESTNIKTKKTDNIGHIDINIKCKESNFDFTIQTLTSLSDHLKSFASDNDIDKLIVNFEYGSFWKYFELSTILKDERDVSKHKNMINKWTSAVKIYLTALATFPKPIIGVLHGNFIGLGVVQLALFDTIISDSVTTIETHYIELDMIPLGFCFWKKSPHINYTLFQKLFWYGEKINAADAHSLSLIYKIVPTNRLSLEACLHAEYLTKIHSTMKQHLIKERTEIMNSNFKTELTAIVEKFHSRISAGDN